MKSKIIPISLVILLVSTIPVYAVKHVDIQYKTIRDNLSLWDKLRMSWARIIRPMTMVGGKLCSTYPDKSGACYENKCTLICNVMTGGCAIDVYTMDYKFLYEKTVGPMQTWDISRNQIYELYKCTKDCTCTKYVEQGCGAGPCASNEMYKTRTCEQHCAEEEVCVAGYEECQPATTTTTIGPTTTTQPGLNDWIEEHKQLIISGIVAILIGIIVVAMLGKKK